MARRRYLIAYDIADPIRLRQVLMIMKAYGTRLQYSVFLCDLTQQELIAWRTNILPVIDLSSDSVVAINLGEPSNSLIEVIGKPRTFPISGPVIV